ncbi:MAG: hypothetical protein Q7V02_06290 [Methylophilus sp.]|nr:hypothetical protein [Methylophilus sp.]
MKPDYEFDAYLEADNSSRVLCNVALWLPKSANENVLIEIDTPERAENFISKYISIKSEIYENNPRFVAKISKAWIKLITGTAEKRKLARTRIQLLHAWDLTITEKVSNTVSDSDLIDKVYFQISNLIYAEPIADRCASYLGGRKAEMEKIFTAQNPKGYVFKIEKHYSGYSKLSQSKEVVSSQNVISVSAEHKMNETEVEALYREAKDFALLLTFSARHQVTILGYEYWTGSDRVRHYKTPTDRLQVKHEEVVERALIPLKYFELFMGGALAKWHTYDEKTKRVINDAIVSIHPLNNSNQSYLNMFSAFEGIVNSFKTNVRTELDCNWPILENGFNTFIDSLSLTDETKQFLKGDLKQIENREKFALKTDACLKRLNIFTDDLWPIFGDNSLYQIRNLLVHGRRTELIAYHVAQEHLQFLLERLVLALLGFDYNMSTVGLINHGIRVRYSQQEIQEFQSQLKTNNGK